MKFPVLPSWCGRFGRGVLLEGCQLLLRAVGRRGLLAALRSAWGGGGNGRGWPGAPAVRPRRPGAANGHRGRHPYAGAA